MLRAPLSTTGELGGDNGASTTRRKVSAAVPKATTGTPRVASQTKQNKTKGGGGREGGRGEGGGARREGEGGRKREKERGREREEDLKT